MKHTSYQQHIKQFSGTDQTTFKDPVLIFKHFGGPDKPKKIPRLARTCGNAGTATAVFLKVKS